ncbi:hypothetical protein WR25_03026 [Diploscapter pachys]|uniref:C2H2-type domain-containing protein n=1 Tax=Diploscapter pachys TaxID=2018661 RepID=A0A2A2LTE1_9BILA|nr:hypothetical protein WR25_03026 [Diploscapter pachys]
MPSNSQSKHTISNKGRKRPGKDLDQIHEDLRPDKAQRLMNQEVDLDLPGDGQFYCIECERYFIDDRTLQLHKKTKRLDIQNREKSKHKVGVIVKTLTKKADKN